MAKTKRDYQIQAEETFFSELDKGTKSGIICLATGAGKTFVAVNILNNPRFNKILWVTHSIELISQSSLAILHEEFDDKQLFEDINAKGDIIDYLDSLDGKDSEDLFGGLTHQETKVKGHIGIVKQHRLDLDCKIVVASIQTIVRRLDKIDANMFDLVIIDECHMACSDTFSKVCNYFKPKFLLGLTATPKRTDGLSLSNLFEKIIFERDIKFCIDNNFLCEIDAVRVKTELSLDTVRTTAGELNSKDLESLVNTSARNNLVVDKYLEYASGRQALTFCVDVQHAMDLAKVFNNRGVNTSFVVGDESLCPDRKYRVDLFRSKKLQVLTNVNILCLDEETEILTESGWTKIDEMTYSHKIANWDNGYVWFKEPKFIIKRERFENENMVSLNSKFKNLRVTDRHNIVWRKRNGEWQKSEAKDLVNMQIELPVSGRFIPEKVEMPIPFVYSKKHYEKAINSNSFALRTRNDFNIKESRELAKIRIDEKLALRYKAPHELTLAECKFIGFWIGDGCKHKTKDGCLRYTLAQAIVYPNIIKWIDNTLTKCGFDFIKRDKSHLEFPHYTYELSRGTGFGNQKRCGVFEIEPYLEKSGSKYLSYLNERQFDALLEGLWFADGNHLQHKKMPKTGCHVASVNKQLLDKLQEIACCRGYRTTLYMGTPKKNKDHQEIWYLSFRKTDMFQVANDRLTIENNYISERVWCVTSHSGNIITRRKGHVTVTGNTAGVDIPDTNCIIMARPTKSLVLYLQAIGRGTRLKSGGGNLLLLDIVDNTSKHELINTWTLDKGKELEDKVFLTKVKKDALIEKREQKRKLDSVVKKDVKLDLLKPPTQPSNALAGWTRERVIEEATEKQLDFLKRLGLYEEGNAYTKGQCSELIAIAPAAAWQIEKAKRWGYDTSKGLTITQFQLIEKQVSSTSNKSITKSL